MARIPRPKHRWQGFVIMNAVRFLSATALASVALVVPGVALAQATQAAPPQTAAVKDSGDVIIVTGSRIARKDLDSPIPLTTIDAAQLLATGDVSLGDALNQLPQLRSTFAQANSGNNIGTSGLSLLDLRGLGTNRTLTLVNGRRRVTATPGSYRVDTNTIPTALLERVDVITGGSSAIYGSDAVSGVVNFVLKRKFEGLTVRGQGGISSRGDRGSYTLSAVAGTSFWDDRANIAISGEFANSNTLFNTDRNELTGSFTGTPGFFTVQNTLGELPAGDGIPDTAFFGTNGPGSKFGFISGGGSFLSACPAVTPTNAAQRAIVCTGALTPTGGRIANNFIFLADGTLVQDVPALDLRPVGGGIFGGRTATGTEGGLLLPGLQRFTGNLLFNMNISDEFQPFIEATFNRVNSVQQSGQAAFVNGRLSPVFFLDNPYLTAQARTLIQQANGTTSPTAAFSMNRFNYDIGTRAEKHTRETFQGIAGFRGTADLPGTWAYEVALNYGRTTTYYETGGNVIVSRFNNATNAARDPLTGNIVCRINIDTNPANDDPNCRPLNLFGEGAPQTTPAGLNYVMHKSFRNEKAEMLNAVAFMSGDSTALFSLPGGPIAFSLGVEYRRETASSAFDPITASNDASGGSTTFLNNIGAFAPPAITTYESSGEIRIPILRGVPFFNELTVEVAGRVSNYSNIAKPIYAYNANVIWSPVSGLRLRAAYARSVRTPNLSDAFATRSETFANGLVDPCSQTVINQDPNRVRNCAAAGIPTTIRLPDGSIVPWVNTAGSGVSGFNQGNPNLQPEVGKSLTIGATFEPRFIPGLSIKLDYYKIKIEQVISGLTGQAIINRCYDDPVSIDNPFCAATFRRFSATDAILNGTFAGQVNRRFGGFPDFILPQTGPGFLNQPFNFAKLETSGIDLDISYRREIAGFKVGTRVQVGWLLKREQFTFISAPTQSTRVAGVLGDPEMEASFSLDIAKGAFDFSYDLQYIGKQTIGAYATQFSHQDRPPTNADAFPFPYYPETFYHDVQFGIKANENFRFYFGIDNLLDTPPPFGLSGTGDGSAIFPLVGRYYYAGFRFTL